MHWNMDTVHCARTSVHMSVRFLLFIYFYKISFFFKYCHIFFRTKIVHYRFASVYRSHNQTGKITKQYSPIFSCAHFFSSSVYFIFNWIDVQLTLFKQVSGFYHIKKNWKQRDCESKDINKKKTFCLSWRDKQKTRKRTWR